MDKDEATLREEIRRALAALYEAMPDGPDKQRMLHLIRVRVNSIPYADLKIKWFEVVGQ